MIREQIILKPVRVLIWICHHSLESNHNYSYDYSWAKFIFWQWVRAENFSNPLAQIQQIIRVWFAARTKKMFWILCNDYLQRIFNLLEYVRLDAVCYRWQMRLVFIDVLTRMKHSWRTSINWASHAYMKTERTHYPAHLSLFFGTFPSPSKF